MRGRRRPPVKAKRRAAKSRDQKPPRQTRPRSAPTYFELLQDAVLTLKANKGASFVQITKVLARKYGKDLDDGSKKHLASALRRLSRRGKIIKKNGSMYQLNTPKVKQNPADPSAPASTEKSGSRESSKSQNKKSKSGSQSHSKSGSRNKSRSGRSTTKSGKHVSEYKNISDSSKVDYYLTRSWNRVLFLPS